MLRPQRSFTVRTNYPDAREIPSQTPPGSIFDKTRMTGPRKNGVMRIAMLVIQDASALASSGESQESDVFTTDVSIYQDCACT